MQIGQYNEKKIVINYKAWNIGNYTNIAACILIKTGLEGKNYIKKKTANKLEDIIKSYKNIKETAD